MQPAIALSSWSLHRTIGLTWPNSPANDHFGEAQPKYGPGALTTMDLPAALKRHGIDRLQLCHFHLASRDPVYLGEIRAALSDAGVVLQTLLIDDGDVTHPSDGMRDTEWIGRWIDAAAILDARSARVIAGKQRAAADTLARSAEALRRLARRGAGEGVRVVTENWLELLAGPEAVSTLLDRLEGEVGLLADFGNWKGPQKYDGLAAILGRAEDTHAKAYFSGPGEMDERDFGRCLTVAADAGYAGPYTLIYEGNDTDEWGPIAIERDFVRDFFDRRAQGVAA